MSSLFRGRGVRATLLLTLLISVLFLPPVAPAGSRTSGGLGSSPGDLGTLQRELGDTSAFPGDPTSDSGPDKGGSGGGGEGDPDDLEFEILTVVYHVVHALLR